MIGGCSLCEWIVRYRRGETDATARAALVKAEMGHLWRHHGEAVPIGSRGSPAVCYVRYSEGTMGRPFSPGMGFMWPSS